MARLSAPGVSVSLSDTASSIPRCYRLAESIVCLGFRHRQHLYKSGFHKQIRRNRVGARAFVYNADDINDRHRKATACEHVSQARVDQPKPGKLATFTGELKNARQDARASLEPCNFRIKQAEGLGQCAGDGLTVNMGEAHLTDKSSRMSRGSVRRRSTGRYAESFCVEFRWTTA